MLQEISGHGRRRLVPGQLRRAEGRRLDHAAARGSTAASTRTASTSRRASKPGGEQNWIAHEWGWAWPKDVADHLQPRLGRPRRQARGRSASATCGGTPSEGKWTSLGDAPDFPPTKAPDYQPRRRREGDRGDRRRQAVHRCTRTGGAGCTRRRASSTARCRPTTSRRSRRSPTRCTPSSRTRRASVFHRPENPYNPSDGEPGAERVPVRAHDLPADRAPHGGRDVAHGAVPGRAAARVLLRGLAAARGRARSRARRLGDDRDRAPGGRGAGDGHRADQAADDPGPPDAPGRRALPLGRRRDRHRRLGQRAAVAGARQQRAHQRVQGRRPATSGPAGGRVARPGWRSSRNTGGARGSTR